MLYYVAFIFQLQLVFRVSKSLTLPSHDGEGICPFERMKRNSTFKIRLQNHEQSHTICDSMKPRRGIFGPQKTPCPWKLFIYKEVIEQLHAQPVTLGSNDGDNIFNGFIITAKKVVTGSPTFKLGQIVGHFEPQWDVIPHCCEGSTTPNMLDGSLNARTKKSNQTLIWTAPKDYLGKFVFVATVWRTINQYWFEIKSPVINVIRKKAKKA